MVHFELIFTKNCRFEGDRFLLNNTVVNNSLKVLQNAKSVLAIVCILNHRRLKIGLKRLKICQNEAKGLVDTDFEEKIKKNNDVGSQDV